MYRFSRVNVASKIGLSLNLPPLHIQAAGILNEYMMQNLDENRPVCRQASPDDLEVRRTFEPLRQSSPSFPPGSPPEFHSNIEPLSNATFPIFLQEAFTSTSGISLSLEGEQLPEDLGSLSRCVHVCIEREEGVGRKEGIPLGETTHVF